MVFVQPIPLQPFRITPFRQLRLLTELNRGNNVHFYEEADRNYFLFHTLRMLRLKYKIDYDLL